MIDTKLFTVDKILAAFLHDSHGNVDAWRKFAEIIPEYETRPVDERFPPKCVVKFKSHFLDTLKDRDRVISGICTATIF